MKCKTQYNCFVVIIVTSNANNVKNIKIEIQKKLNIITNGCSAHLLNLLVSDVNILNVKEHIVQITKYFKNNYFASPKFKEEKHSKLILPQDVGRNTLTA